MCAPCPNPCAAACVPANPGRCSRRYRSGRRRIAAAWSLPG
jgi:hypothetical protein